MRDGSDREAAPDRRALTRSGERPLTRSDDRNSSHHGIRKSRCSLSIRPVVRTSGWLIWRRSGSPPNATSLTEKEQRGGHLRVSMRPGRLVRQDHAARNSAGFGLLYPVREPGPQSDFGADVQVRITARVDRCDRSRGQEPLRTGSRQLAAFQRRPQSNAHADSQAARPASAMRPRSPFRGRSAHSTTTYRSLQMKYVALSPSVMQPTNERS